MKYLDNMGEDEILELNIPTGVPLVYEFDENFKPIKHYHLGNAEEIAAKAAVSPTNAVKRSNFYDSAPRLGATLIAKYRTGRESDQKPGHRQQRSQRGPDHLSLAKLIIQRQ